MPMSEVSLVFGNIFGGNLLILTRIVNGLKKEIKGSLGAAVAGKAPLFPYFLTYFQSVSHLWGPL